MGDLLRALTSPDMAFLRYAFLAGLLASVAFGIAGAYVVARRISYLAGAIAHCVLAGIGLSLYLKAHLNLPWLNPLYGAVASGLAAAVLLGLVSIYAQEREDTAIGALWSIGMAIGLVFLAKTPGYVDPMGYLFGNILMISRADLWLIAALDAIVIVLAVYFHNIFVAVCFDEEFARIRGIRVEAYYILLLCLTALTVVLLMSIVGIVMVIALLTLPAGVAGRFANRIWQMMALAVLFCAVFTEAGLAVSYIYDLPSGPVIILVGGTAYLVSTVTGRVLRRGAR